MAGISGGLLIVFLLIILGTLAAAGLLLKAMIAILKGITEVFKNLF